MNIIINPKTEKHLNSLIKNLPQSLLLYGPSGVGLSEIARYIANQLETMPEIVLPTKDEIIDIEKGSITVEQMRRLYDELKTKSTSRRLIIIDYAEKMTAQSQNAFLKLLEEPGENIHFILLSHSTQKLLPTILSRVEKLEIKPVDSKQSEKLLSDLKITDKTKLAQITFIASGLPAEITRLATNDEYFNKRTEIVRDARDYLQGNFYKKLLIAQKYRDNRPNTLTMLLDSAKLLKRTISENPNSDSVKSLTKIMNIYDSIEANGNIRICLARGIL